MTGRSHFKYNMSVSSSVDYCIHVHPRAYPSAVMEVSSVTSNFTVGSLSIVPLASHLFHKIPHRLEVLLTKQPPVSGLAVYNSLDLLV